MVRTLETKLWRVPLEYVLFVDLFETLEATAKIGSQTFAAFGKKKQAVHTFDMTKPLNNTYF